MIGTTLGHYRLLRRLGAGGMGEVYAAEDTKLKRQVALKVLPPEMAVDPVRRARFQREAEAVAALDHPNIVTIYSVESASTDEEERRLVHFFTMQLIDGRTLGELIPEGGLPLDRFLDLALPLADALSAAHRKGITHRDLKPGNVMVGDDGRVRVLDFGLAKLHRTDRDDASSEETRTHNDSDPLTREGIVVGTAPYMSPEQVKGLPVDARSDLFSLGSILYEMIGGHRPFTGTTSAEVTSAILRDVPGSVCEGRGELPADVDRILERCLRKHPDERYQTADELRLDLESLRGEAGVLGAAAELPTRELTSASRSPEKPRSSSLTLPVKPSLAVLPFVNLSGDPEQDYFAAGLWADINTDLVKVSGLFLISTQSTGQYQGKQVSAQQAGRELGVRHVLEGTVRRAGDHVRVTAQLVDTETGEPIWAERYDRNIDDLFALQDELNEEIVTALDIKLVSGEGHRIIRRSIKNPQARDIFYKALAALFTMNREQQVEARRLLDIVAELEPDSPFSFTFAAMSHYIEAGLKSGDEAQESLEQALACASRARELEDVTGIGHMIRGMVYLKREQHEAALEESENALRHRPSCPWVYALRGSVLNYTSEPARALELARTAIRLTPLFPPIFPAVLATSHYLLGQHEEAADAAADTVELAPDTLEAHVIRAAALAASGATEDLPQTLAEIVRIRADFTLDDFAGSQPYADSAVLDGLIADLRAAGLS